MRCSNPRSTAHGLFGCGQCIACRINKRRQWTARLILESQSHKDMSFVTLTYDDWNVPFNDNNDFVLEPRHLRLFLGRLRKHVYPVKIRFFAVGEYGENTQRPHYHLALFGLPSCEYGVTRHPDHDRTCCASCDRLKSVWELGNIYQGQLSDQSIAYVCGYVVKKWTNPDHYKLQGRPPEFTRMSRNPGLGSAGILAIAAGIQQWKDKIPDVPSAFRAGTRSFPLDRFSKNRLRQLLELPEGAPQWKREEVKAQLQNVRSLAEAEGKSLNDYLAPEIKALEASNQRKSTLRGHKKGKL